MRPGLVPVADVHDALKACVKLIEHAKVGADAEGENGCVNGDLVRLGVLVLLDVDEAVDVAHTLQARADELAVVRLDNDGVILDFLEGGAGLDLCAALGEEHLGLYYIIIEDTVADDGHHLNDDDLVAVLGETLRGLEAGHAAADDDNGAFALLERSKVVYLAAEQQDDGGGVIHERGHHRDGENDIQKEPFFAAL